ncbi:MAG: nitrous oxide reductase accessory protein NosL, partial [Nitrospirae bacterium]
MKYLKGTLMAVLVVFTLAGLVFGAGPVKPKMKDKCPVCGMMPAKFP